MIKDEDVDSGPKRMTRRRSIQCGVKLQEPIKSEPKPTIMKKKPSSKSKDSARGKISPEPRMKRESSQKKHMQSNNDFDDQIIKTSP